MTCTVIMLTRFATIVGSAGDCLLFWQHHSWLHHTRCRFSHQLTAVTAPRRLNVVGFIADLRSVAHRLGATRSLATWVGSLCLVAGLDRRTCRPHKWPSDRRGVFDRDDTTSALQRSPLKLRKSKPFVSIRPVRARSGGLPHKSLYVFVATTEHKLLGLTHYACRKLNE